MPASLLLVPVLALQDPAPDAAGPPVWVTPLMFAAFGAIFYFLLIRPQSQKDKQQRQMLAALKKKDRVLIAGGLFGTVADLRDDELTLRISENPDVKVRVRRSSVVEVLKETAEPPSR